MNIAPRLVPRRGVVMAWRAWYPRGFGPSGSPRGMHKHSTLHTTFRQNRENRAVPSLSLLLKLSQTNQEIQAFRCRTESPQLAIATRSQCTPNGPHPIPTVAYRSPPKIFG